jgi:uncharacterized protein (UPF0548 family)
MSFTLRKPSAESIQHFLERQATLGYTYEAVGATSDRPPAGYVVDHTRIKLGTGEDAFNAARAAIERWEHFRLGWVEAWPSESSIQPGAAVAVLAHLFGLWWLNACKLVYVVDEAGPITRYGFAYGTLPAHAESGEERFLIEWDRVDGGVWYDILAFSRPNYVLTRLGYPIVRRIQKTFARDSAAATLAATNRSPESIDPRFPE